LYIVLIISGVRKRLEYIQVWGGQIRWQNFLPLVDIRRFRRKYLSGHG
jgi:hypothetical protein